MAFTKILPAGISTTGLVTVGSLSVGDVTLTGDTDNLIINTDTVTVRPTLDLNFARDKRLDSKITFTRDSVGTYVDANGLIQTAVNNIPRFDHDPVTGESLGLLIEESRTNLAFPSENFTTWSNQEGTGVANSAISPSGENTAYSFIASTTVNTTPRLYKIITVSSGVNYTYSYFVKPFGNYTKVMLRIGGQSGSPAIVWDTITKTIDQQRGTFISSFIEEYPNGWFKVGLTMQTNLTTYAPNMGAVSDTYSFSGGSGIDEIQFTGDGVSGAYIWGAQLEAGSFPTSYIPTSGSTVTRAVDEATITGTNFTDWYNASEGSIFAKYSAGTNVSEVPFAITKTGSESAYVIAIAASSSGPDIGVVPTIVVADGGVTQTGVTVPITPVDGDVIRTAIGYKENDFAIHSATDTESGFASDSSGTIPTVDIARIGKYPYYGIWQNRPIARILYYPKRLPNAQLQNLTK